MLRRLRHLKEAIGGLKSSGEVECMTPSQEQWQYLAQVEDLLSVAAKFQRRLEGEKYITGSL